MNRTIVSIVLALCVMSASIGASADDTQSSANGYGQTVASAALLKVLAVIQKLDQGGMLGLQVWAGYPKPTAADPVMTDLDQIEADILTKLSPGDRAAVFSWLKHGGRSKLYARGATDADIGPCVDLVDSASCNTTPSRASTASAASTSFRDLPFTLAPGSADTGGISIDHGFAVVKSDATSETHCLSFKNTGSKKVDAITFVYKLHAQSGAVVFAGSNLRSGNFDPGTNVAGPATPADLAAIHSDGPDKALLANCWTKTTQLATPALLRAIYITVGVGSVTYDDGTHWALGQ